MAKEVASYADDKGNLHKTPEGATKADLATLLGKLGEGESLAPGIAAHIFEKRKELERIFKEHDDMTADKAAASHHA